MRKGKENCFGRGMNRISKGAFAECENLSQVNLSSRTMFIPQSEEYPSFPEAAKINSGKN